MSELHEVNVQFWETEFISRQLFCDFGEEFQVLDQDGEAPVSAAVQNVTKVGSGVFFKIYTVYIFITLNKFPTHFLSQGTSGMVVYTDEKHGLPDEAMVSFSDVQGTTELNNQGPVHITYLS